MANLSDELQLQAVLHEPAAAAAIGAAAPLSWVQLRCSRDMSESHDRQCDVRPCWCCFWHDLACHKGSLQHDGGAKDRKGKATSKPVCYPQQPNRSHGLLLQPPDQNTAILPEPKLHTKHMCNLGKHTCCFTFACLQRCIPAGSHSTVI